MEANNETTGVTQTFWQRHRDMVRGSLAGGVSAALVTVILTSPQPSNASATTLLGPLASIGSQINNYMSMMDGWIDDWLPRLEGIVDTGTLNNAINLSDSGEQAVQDALQGSAGFHAQGEGTYMDLLNDGLSIIESNGEIDAAKAAEMLSPPTLLDSAGLSGEGITKVWDHALLLTGDQPLRAVSEQARDTLAGTEYEYKRLQTLQTRILAQDAIQNYPLAGAKMEGYRDHLSQFSDPSSISNMTPGQMAGTALNMAASVEIPVALDQLETNLRQERLLGALLAQEAKRATESLMQERR